MKRIGPESETANAAETKQVKTKSAIIGQTDRDF
jgi:hypothetical protein